jgi:hypothetical protein
MAAMGVERMRAIEVLDRGAGSVSRGPVDRLTEAAAGAESCPAAGAGARVRPGVVG